MTKAASDLDQGKICRVCLHEEDFELDRELIDIFSNEGGFSVVDSLQQICAIDISKDDNLPQLICSLCLPRLRNAFFLRVLSQRSQETLLANRPSMVIASTEDSPSFEYIGFTEMLSEFKSEDEDTVSCEDLTFHIRCCGCEKDFDTENELRKHSIQKHCPKKLDLLSSGKIRCSVCYVELDGESDVREHQAQYPYVKALRGCSYCRCNFYSVSTLELHIRQFHADRRYKCCGCEFQSDNQIDLATHTLFHKHAARKLHKEDYEDGFQCAVCYARFETLRKRQIHERKPYEEFKTELPSPIVTTKPAAKIPKRHKTVKTLPQPMETEPLKDSEHQPDQNDKTETPLTITDPHRKIPKSPERKRPRISSHTCETCSAIIPDEESLLSHQCIVVFECSDCPKKFIKKESLDSHKCSRTVYSCDKCSKKYPNRAAMLSCMRKHEIPQPPPIPDNSTYQCSLCYEYFKTPEILRKHKTTHLPQRNFTCRHPPCTASFLSPQGRDNHEVCHTNRVTYRCEVCGKTTNRRQRYVTHYENIHATDADRIHGCNLCEQRFSKDYFLANHLNFVHHVKPVDAGWKAKFRSKKDEGKGSKDAHEGDDETDDS